MRILVVSPRVAPGILTLEAWDALRAADRVVSAEDGPHVQGIRSAGIDVEISALRPDDEDRDVLWIAPPGDVTWARDVAMELTDATGADAGELEVILGSHDLPGSRLLDLVAVMDRLRRECPWTQLQTHESLAPYLTEETEEALQAIASGDGDDLIEELGDVLMQVVFHAAIAAEGPEVHDIDDVAAGITDKLVRRNPHVFGDAVVTSADEVDAQWNRIKAEEKQRKRSWSAEPVSPPGSAKPHD
jgi:XTP/dITP diphosphohydrolase